MAFLEFLTNYYKLTRNGQLIDEEKQVIFKVVSV